MRRILVFALFLAVLALANTGGAGAQEQVGTTVCTPPGSSFCVTLEGLVIPAPDSVVDVGPVYAGGYYDGENCRVSWANGYTIVQWSMNAKWSMNGSCDVYSNEPLGQFSSQGRSYLAPVPPF